MDMDIDMDIDMEVNADIDVDIPDVTPLRTAAHPPSPERRPPVA
jgi:hypothetical protein